MSDQDLKELLDRTRRLESRMVQLGDHVGANLRSKQRIEIKHAAAGDGHSLYVEIDALDVSVSRILTELRQHEVHRPAIGVFHEGRLVFTVYPNGALTT